MNERRENSQYIKIFEIKTILIFIIVLITSLADVLADNSNSSLPPLPDRAQVAGNDTSIFKKISNFLGGLFGGDKKQQGVIVKNSINKELDENLANLNQQDEGTAKNNLNIAQSNTDKVNIKNDQLNTSPKDQIVKEDANKNNALEQDADEIFTIPSLPEDKQENSQQNSDISAKKEPLATTQSINAAKNNILSSNQANEILGADNKAEDRNNVADDNKNKNLAVPIQSEVSNEAPDPIAEELQRLKNSKGAIALEPKNQNSPVAKRDNINTEKSLQDKNKENIDQNTQQREYELIQEQNKFVTDEVKVLLLPEDDVVLGKTSKQANLEYMDDYDYINAFAASENLFDDSAEHQYINQFIDDYGNSIYKRDAHNHVYKILSIKEASSRAFKAVASNNLSELKTLLDNYPILQKKDKFGQNLLHLSVKLGQYSLSEYLIMRGININAMDNQQNSPLSLSIQLVNNELTELLQKAGAR